MRAWLWFIRKFGFRTAFWWWRTGTKQGWMTKEQSDALLAVIVSAEAALAKEDTA